MNLLNDNEKAFFDRYGYQMCTADFVGFVIDSTGDGGHNISLVTDNVDVEYAYSKIKDIDLVSSKTNVRELCVAVEKTYGMLPYIDQNYAPGFMIVTSYSHKADGSVNYHDSTIRGYWISRWSVKPLDAVTVKRFFGPELDEHFTYADAWPSEGMCEGVLSNYS